MALERRKVWQCIGCGRIEDQRPCVGICQDRKEEYVLAAEHDIAIEALAKLGRAIAHTTPREGECLRHWRALQEQARSALAMLD
jgi:hypothetical protein